MTDENIQTKTQCEFNNFNINKQIIFLINFNDKVSKIIAYY
jgi:hypothetical protein